MKTIQIFRMVKILNIFRDKGVAEIIEVIKTIIEVVNKEDKEGVTEEKTEGDTEVGQHVAGPILEVLAEDFPLKMDFMVEITEVLTEESLKMDSKEKISKFMAR